MGLRKAKHKLSAIFRVAMRNAGRKPPDAANTAEAVAGEYPEMDFNGQESWGSFPDILSPLKSFTDPSNTVQQGDSSGGTSSLAGLVSSGFGVKPRKRKDDNDFSSKKKTLELSAFLSGKLPPSTKKQHVARGRLQFETFKKNQSQLMKKLSKGCARKLGQETTFEVLFKMGKEAGEREYNARIQVCVENARRSNDAEYVLDQVGKAIEYLKEMRQGGFSIKEGTYGPFFRYLVDMEMVEEFQIFKEFIREASPESVERLVYYEMLLWIQVNDEEKIRELCNTVDYGGRISLSTLQEYHLVALCEKDRKEDLQKLLEIVDITKVSSPEVLKSVFEYLGNSLLEAVAMKLLLELRDSGEVETVSNLIFSYASCIPNSTVDDAILKFNNLHEELDIVPSSSSYEKLVNHLCGSNEVATALDVVENMCEEGLEISENILHSLLDAIAQILEFDLVQRIHSIMSNKCVKPNSETFRRSISLCIRIKDFEGAYNMLGNLKNFNLAPNSSMYNSIMAGYFREKNVNKALMVLKEMKEADVKPDSVTFSYLINYCDQEEAIAEYYKEMKEAGVQASKHIYMSLIKAYASCKQFEKAKQVLMDQDVPTKDHNELKSVLIHALASNGNITDALSIYEEMKEAGCHVDPKTIITLIDHADSNEELATLAQLAHELNDSKYWIDGLFKIVLFAVRNNKSCSILDLLKETKNDLSKDDIALEYWLEEVFRSIAETEPSDVKLGLDLLGFMKEELGLCPSRKCLDFLLHACVNAKDKQTALVVWKEYQFAELPYNVLNYLRMYQVLVAAGDSKSAKEIASKIPKDDRDVKCIIKESRVVFTPKPKKKTSKKKRLSLSCQAK
ncbi:pentatricopeptide repeat-containing protein At4g21880, mitochondrial-like isoform X2 [Brassica napus]|uniref:pentatricopeptide repeat-containing protein At4g21880, mitochondrial-like isoform X2 n=1 Tax=Brassica napus TaxID=3708 RepID=UPI0006AA6154|nr:pentatricopeptide repeat-containing protein At4g21880, mitochondrial-like isoform X2 [Brassica napus]